MVYVMSDSVEENVVLIDNSRLVILVSRNIP